MQKIHFYACANFYNFICNHFVILELLLLLNFRFTGRTKTRFTVLRTNNLQPTPGSLYPKDVLAFLLSNHRVVSASGVCDWLRFPLAELHNVLYMDASQHENTVLVYMLKVVFPFRRVAIGNKYLWTSLKSSSN